MPEDIRVRTFGRIFERILKIILGTISQKKETNFLKNTNAISSSIPGGFSRRNFEAISEGYLEDILEGISG